MALISIRSVILNELIVMLYIRLSFAFMNCPLCIAFMDHPALLPEMTPFLKQFEDIKSKSLQV